MPPIKIELTSLVITAKSPLAIGSGYARGLLDRTVVRSASGLVYIPGSVLKGKTRAACELLMQHCKLGNIHSPHPESMYNHTDPCLVCKLFGRPGHPSTLRWHNLHLDRQWVDAVRPSRRYKNVFGQTFERTQIQMSRRRNLAAEAHLFSGEFTANHLRFEARPTLTGWLDLTPVSLADKDAVYYELIVLFAGLRMLTTLGGNVSRGAGIIDLELPETVKAGGKEISIQSQLDHFQLLDLCFDESAEETG